MLVVTASRRGGADRARSTAAGRGSPPRARRRRSRTRPRHRRTASFVPAGADSRVSFRRAPGTSSARTVASPMATRPSPRSLGSGPASRLSASFEALSSPSLHPGPEASAASKQMGLVDSSHPVHDTVETSWSQRATRELNHVAVRASGHLRPPLRWRSLDDRVDRGADASRVDPSTRANDRMR